MQLTNLFLSCPQVPSYLQVGKRKDLGQWDAKNNVVFSDDLSFNGKPLPEPTEALEGVCFIVSQAGNTVIGYEKYWAVNNVVACNGISWSRYVVIGDSVEIIADGLGIIHDREFSRFP